MDISSKIKSIDEIAKISLSLKKEGKVIVLCHGEFDLFHPGHLRYLMGAKKQGDILIVTVTPDEYINKGPGRPVFNQNIRAEFIASLEITDYVGINNWPTAVELLHLIKPDVYCKGAEYKDRDKDITGRIKTEEEVIKSLGGCLHLIDDITFSSSHLINKHIQIYTPQVMDFLNNFSKKHDYNELIEKIRQINKLRILIIGDTIIDEYCYCEPMGKSPKSPIITAKFISSEMFMGGILATANNIAQFCDNVSMISCLGENCSHEKYISDNINPKIKHKFFIKKNSQTIVKRRYIDKAFLGKLFAVNFLNDIEIEKELEDEILSHLKKIIKNFDIVIVNDFGHGLITEKIIKSITDSTIYITVNTQTNSANLGFNMITKYPRANYVCIDEPELRLATHEKTVDIKVLMKKIYETLNCDTITITRGHKGSIVYNKDYGYCEAPVLSSQVIDTIGAGDAFFAITSPLVKLGFTPEEIAFIGNAVGALYVQIVCNREPIIPHTLFKFITTLLK